jgi:hypothetical protein
VISKAGIELENLGQLLARKKQNFKRIGFAGSKDIRRSNSAAGKDFTRQVFSSTVFDVLNRMRR